MIFKQYTLNGKRRVSNGKRHVIQRKQTRENVCSLCLNANSCTMAAARMSADKYLYFSSDNMVDKEAHPLDGFQNYLGNSRFVRVKGRLRSHITFWKSIGASKFISIIQFILVAILYCTFLNNTHKSMF